MNPNRRDIWEVNHAAAGLIAQAYTLAALHLDDGTARLRFGFDVARYAKRITDAVWLGHKTEEQGLEDLLQEQQHLLDQSRRIKLNSLGLMNNVEERTPPVTPALFSMRPDPTRLLRYLHEQEIKAADQNALNTMVAAQPPAPRDTYKLFGSDNYPAPVPLHQPGFYLVRKSTTAQELEAQLFSSAASDVIAKYRALNPGLDRVKAGQLIVLSDPNNPRCTREEALLMAAASKVNQALEPLTPDEADFMALHRPEIESFLKYGSAAIGIGESIFSSQLKGVETVLADIEELHQKSFQRDGHLRSAEFFQKRKTLFSRLDAQLTSLIKTGIGFPDHPNLKAALGISSRSLVRHWTQAGAPGQIPGYATHLDNVARAAKYLKYGGWIGTAIGGGASYVKVQEVCAAGNTEACEKVRFTETGGFVGGVAGGAAGGMVLTAACGLLTPATAGAVLLGCAIVVVGGGSFAAGYGGGKIGEYLGELIYEAAK
ncbi:MAG TPA: hypothetical protein VF682_20460 [Pseudomonas sp.]